MIDEAALKQVMASVFEVSADTITADSSHQGTLIEYGPFIRMAYNFAGPSRSARMAVKEEREIWTNNPPTGSRRYVAHFGFEKSELSLVGASLVRQAAEDIKHGRPATIAIAATDRDAGSAYSRMLSQRRADAIRAALLRDGVAASQIDVAAEAEITPTPGPATSGTTGSRGRAKRWLPEKSATARLLSMAPTDSASE
jgi:outer membrane protein OmpA-like peptidoglycan-associated protein